MRTEAHLFSNAADQRRPLLLNFVLLLVDRPRKSGLVGKRAALPELQLGAHYICSSCEAGCVCANNVLDKIKLCMLRFCTLQPHCRATGGPRSNCISQPATNPARTYAAGALRYAQDPTRTKIAWTRMRMHMAGFDFCGSHWTSELLCMSPCHF